MESLKTLLHAVERGQAAVLATVTHVTGSAPRGPGARLVVVADGARSGTVGGGEIEDRVLTEARTMLQASSPPHRVLEVSARCGGTVTVFLERFADVRRVLIVGGGHVGRAVAEIASGAGFQVTVLDRSLEAASSLPRGVTHAAAADPGSLASIERPESMQVLVATGSHDADIAWAVAALRAGFAGIGVVASRSKAEAIRRAAEREGIPDERLSRLRAPVGLDLGAVTPGEIAVAIVSELVILAHGSEVPPAWRKSQR
ncbi:MAG: XdhC family protein [Acidobacteriota bacterium]